MKISATAPGWVYPPVAGMGTGITRIIAATIATLTARTATLRALIVETYALSFRDYLTIIPGYYNAFFSRSGEQPTLNAF
jgi:hypothetical protein